MSTRFISFEPLLSSIEVEEHVWLGLDWVIVGGETGPGARHMNPDWAFSIKRQCEATGVAFFMKKMAGGAEPPPSLLVREFPTSERVVVQ